MITAGAEVIHLRSTKRAPVSGHALLIGAPLGPLKRVDECLADMVAWLCEQGFEVHERGEPTAAGIRLHMEALIEAARSGDSVLVYYAGHGSPVMAEISDHELPLVVQLPMDLDEAFEVITGDEWLGWMRSLANEVGADTKKPDAGVVTVILECCHSSGLFDEWPAGTRERVTQRLAAKVRAKPVYRDVDALPSVVRVFASGRDDRARVGALTKALLELFRKHPGEPWWALMDRVHAGWTIPNQTPGVAGRAECVPLSLDRVPRPDGLLPVVWTHDAWQVPLGPATGWQANQRVGLTPSLGLPAQARALVEPGAARLRVVEPGAGWSGNGFAWARPEPARSRAIVGVSGVEPQRGEVQRRLSSLVSKALALPESSMSGPEEHDVRFRVRADGVDVIDRVGEVVACTSLDADELWVAWIDRLVSLERWLAVTEQGTWRPRGLALRWGEGVDGERSPWPEGPREIEAGVSIWLEVTVDPSELAFATVFRVRADRAVEELTAFVPGGMPLSGPYPVATLGTRTRTLELAWPDGLAGGPRTEWLVVILSQQPIPLSALARRAVGEPKPKRRMRGGTLAGMGDGGRELAMVVREYRLLEPGARAGAG